MTTKLRKTCALLAFAAALAGCFSLAAASQQAGAGGRSQSGVASRESGVLDSRLATRDSRLENTAALANFFRALAAVQSRRRLEPVRIMHFGDSHTTADILTGEIRRNFQRDFGDDGAGYLAPRTATARGRRGVWSGATRGRSTKGISESTGGKHGLKGLSLRGIVSEHRRSPGVSYEVLGQNGARATQLTRWSHGALAESLSRHNPDLIIIAYGTNEVTDKDWTMASYQRLLAGIVRGLRRAAPGAAILVYGPPDRSDNELAARRMPLMLEAQRSAAFEAGAAFWNSYEAMGGRGAMNAWLARGWAEPDRVHLTRAGYTAMGRAFYADMIRAYNCSDHDEESCFGRGARKSVDALHAIDGEIAPVLDRTDEVSQEFPISSQRPLDGILRRRR